MAPHNINLPPWEEQDPELCNYLAFECQLTLKWIVTFRPVRSGGLKSAERMLNMWRIMLDDKLSSLNNPDWVFLAKTSFKDYEPKKEHYDALCTLLEDPRGSDVDALGDKAKCEFAALLWQRGIELLGIGAVHRDWWDSPDDEVEQKERFDRPCLLCDKAMWSGCKNKPPQPLKTVACLHAFHASCLDAYFEQQGLHCPRCHVTLTEDELL